jgi:hypothetical protein
VVSAVSCEHALNNSTADIAVNKLLPAHLLVPLPAASLDNLPDSSLINLSLKL